MRDDDQFYELGKQNSMYGLQRSYVVLPESFLSYSAFLAVRVRLYLHRHTSSLASVLFLFGQHTLVYIRFVSLN